MKIYNIKNVENITDKLNKISNDVSIKLEIRDLDTNRIQSKCSLKTFLRHNNYDDVNEDATKIRNTKVGSVAFVIGGGASVPFSIKRIK